MDILNDVDKFRLYRGLEIEINNRIKLKPPTLQEIVDEDYGEKKYFNFVNLLCAVGADLKWQLDDAGIDYTKIDDFELFCKFIAPSIDKKTSKIVFNDDLDFSAMKVFYNEKIQDYVLVQKIHNIKEVEVGNKWLNKIRILFHKPIKTKVSEEQYEIKIDRLAYLRMVAALRYMHKTKRNDELPGNETTRRFFIEEAREDYEKAKNKDYKSQLFNIISTLVVTPGFKHDEKTVFDMNIVAFYDAVGRTQKVSQVDLLLQSGYSGFGINLKDIKKEELNKFADL